MWVPRQRGVMATAVREGGGCLRTASLLKRAADAACQCACLCGLGWLAGALSLTRGAHRREQAFPQRNLLALAGVEPAVRPDVDGQRGQAEEVGQAGQLVGLQGRSIRGV